MTVDWTKIDTCFLDMDGTLLDLRYDHQVWHVELPRRFAAQANLSMSDAKSRIDLITEKKKGTLSWYDLDFWRKNINIDIDDIEIALSDQVSLRYGAIDFLKRLRRQPVTIFLVTNAHPRGLQRKLRKTHITEYFDHILSSHNIGQAKESLIFWNKIYQKYKFDKPRSLLLDDNLNVLETARKFGIGHIYGVKKPNSEGEPYSSEDFPLIEDYSTLA